MKALITRLICALILASGATYAVANYTATPGAGLNFLSFDVGGVKFPGFILSDAATGTTDVGSAIAAAAIAPVPWLATTAWDTNGPYTNGSTNAGAADLRGAPFVDIGAIGGNKVTGSAIPVTTGSADPCQAQTPTIKPISVTSATTTNIVTGTSAKKLYVCYLYLQTGIANNVAVISGTTGATCGANTAALVGGTTAANGLNNAANSGQAFGNGGYSAMQVQTNNDDICLITSSVGPLSGVIKYVVQ